MVRFISSLENLKVGKINMEIDSRLDLLYIEVNDRR